MIDVWLWSISNKTGMKKGNAELLHFPFSLNIRNYKLCFHKEKKLGFLAKEQREPFLLG